MNIQSSIIHSRQKLNRMNDYEMMSGYTENQHKIHTIEH